MVTLELSSKNNSIDLFELLELLLSPNDLANKLNKRSRYENVKVFIF